MAIYVQASEWHLEGQEEHDGYEIEDALFDKFAAYKGAAKMASEFEEMFADWGYAPDSWWRVDVYRFGDDYDLDDLPDAFEDDPETLDCIWHLDSEVK